MATPLENIDAGIGNIWTSDYVQKNPNKAYKVSYNAEYLAVAAYLNGGSRPNPTSYSKMGKGLVQLEDARRGLVAEPEPGPYLLDEKFDSVIQPPWHKYWWWNDNGKEGDAYWTKSDWEAQASRDYNVTTPGGILTLTAKKENVTDFQGRPCPYSSGMIQTNGKQGWIPRGFGFTFGKAEARIKVAKGQGMWSGFWLCDDRYDSPWCSREIDILEVIGNQPNHAHMNFHAADINTHQGSSWISPTPLADDFHIYGVEWRASFIAWYIDGIERFRYTGVGIPTNPHYVILNLVVGTPTSWPGAPDATTVFPNTMQVDWVRVSP